MLNADESVEPASAGDASERQTDPVLDTSQAAVFEDQAGDATGWGTGDADTVARCEVGSAVSGSCLDAPAEAPGAGTPGPFLDIVSVAYEGETRDDVVVSLEIAELSEGFDELEDPPGINRKVTYEVCLVPEEGGSCDRVVTLDVAKDGGEAVTDASLDIRSEECNEWSWCAWEVGTEIEFGEPAEITFTIPKAYLAPDDAPLAGQALEAETTWFAEWEDFPRWHPGLTVHTPVYHFHTHGGGPFVPNIADTTERFDLGVEFSEPAETPAPPEDRILFEAEPGLTHGSDGRYDTPELDLLGMDLYEENDELVAAFVVREFEEQPAFDFDYSLAVGLEGNVWEMGYRQEGDEAYGYSGRCVMEPCQDGKLTEPEVEVTRGSPAIIEVRTPLEFIGEPEPGTQTNLFWVMTMRSDVNYYWGDHSNDDPYGDYHSVYVVDSIVGGQPYEFGSGHQGPLERIASPS